MQLSQDGSRLVVGARGGDGGGSNSGSAKVFDWSGSAWQQIGTDIDGSSSNDFAGHAVAIATDGSHVAIGSPGNDSGGADAGHARVFEAS